MARQTRKSADGAIRSTGRPLGRPRTRWGRKLLKRRIALDWSRGTMARRLGIATRTYEDLERGRREPSGTVQALFHMLPEA